MSSIYEKIATAEELVKVVRMNGISTKMEDIVRMQDIIGNSSVEKLVTLANNIGRLNDEKEPDPKGTWSGGVNTRNTFYSILFHIWNWEDATRFYNEHSNEAYIESREAINELKQVRKNYTELDSRAAELELKVFDLSVENEEKDSTIAELTDEVTRLKAKLYDVLCKE